MDELEKLTHSTKSEIKFLKTYEVKASDGLFRIFLNLGISYEKLTNEDKQKINDKLKNIDGVKKGDIFKLDNNGKITISRKNNLGLNVDILTFETNNKSKERKETNKTQIKTETKEKTELIKIEAFLTKNSVKKDKIKKILENIKLSGIKDIKVEEMKFSNGVFYILRDSKPIFYESINNTSLIFGEKGDNYFVSENFLENPKDVEEVEKELEKLVEVSIDDIIPKQRDEKIDKNKAKSEAKKELHSEISRIKKEVKKAKSEKINQIDYPKILGLKNINLQEIRAIGFFESYFNKNAVSSGKAYGINGITKTAERQAKKEHNFKIGNLSNPNYNTLVCSVYLRWIEKYFLQDSDKKEGKKIVKEISGKYYKNSYEVVGNYLKNKKIEIDPQKFGQLVAQINSNPEYLNKFLILRKYNADSSKNSGEILEHKNYYALTVFYLSKYEKQEIAQIMKEKKIG